MQFADTLNVSKREFYLQIGVSRGTLESKTGITEDILTKFIAAYPNVSIEWLMQGKGDMLVSESEDKNKNSVTERSHIQELTQIIQNQAKTLLEQQRFINAHFPKVMRGQISTPPLSDVERSPDIEHIKD